MDLQAIHGSLHIGEHSAGATFAPANIQLPPVTAPAAYLMIEHGPVVFARSATEMRAPASLAKLMTAIVVRGFAALDEQVEVVECDQVDASQSSSGIGPGESYTVEQLLYALLLPSGNDAALALARYVGARVLRSPLANAKDAIEEFVRLMNCQFASLNFWRSRFTNPSGIDADGNHATPRDLAHIVSTVMSDAVLCDIVATTTYSIQGLSRTGPIVRALENTNQLLQWSNVLGVKTGTTDAAGRCLAAAALLPSGHTAISIVMGCAGKGARYRDTLALLSSVGFVAASVGASHEA